MMYCKTRLDNASSDRCSTAARGFSDAAAVVFVVWRQNPFLLFFRPMRHCWPNYDDDDRQEEHFDGNSIVISMRRFACNSSGQKMFKKSSKWEHSNTNGPTGVCSIRCPNQQTLLALRIVSGERDNNLFYLPTSSSLLLLLFIDLASLISRANISAGRRLPPR